MMNQDHAANVAAKVLPGIPPSNWRRTALDAAPTAPEALHGSGQVREAWTDVGKNAVVRRADLGRSDKFSQGWTPPGLLGYTVGICTRRTRHTPAFFGHCRTHVRWDQASARGNQGGATSRFESRRNPHSSTQARLARPRHDQARPPYL